MWPARILLDPRLCDKDRWHLAVKVSCNMRHLNENGKGYYITIPHDETQRNQDAIIFRCVWYVFLGVLGLPLLFAPPACFRRIGPAFSPSSDPSQAEFV